MLEDSDAVIDTASIQISQNADATAGGHLFRQKRDRRGFGFVADDLNSAKKELGDWRAVDIALDRTPSFVKGEFWDCNAWLAAVITGQPCRSRSSSSSPEPRP